MNSGFIECFNAMKYSFCRQLNSHCFLSPGGETLWLRKPKSEWDTIWHHPCSLDTGKRCVWEQGEDRWICVPDFYVSRGLSDCSANWLGESLYPGWQENGVGGNVDKEYGKSFSRSCNILWQNAILIWFDLDFCAWMTKNTLLCLNSLIARMYFDQLVIQALYH